MTLTVFPFEVGDIVSHKTNPAHQNLEIIDIVECKFTHATKCEFCVFKKVIKVNEEGWGKTGCWCIWNSEGIICWEKVSETTKGPVNYYFNGAKWKPDNGSVIFHDLELFDGDVLLVQIPNHWPLERYHHMYQNLDTMFEKKGWYKRDKLCASNRRCWATCIEST